MPVVTIDWWSGKQEKDRRELVEEVSATVSRIAACPLEAVTVVIRDVGPAHWGSGGRLAADL
ncbi:4-oxalocrotonate tautomerase family protein [Streptomyces stramineus]|uniref:4-oxalocrotonate tautomerase-like domain-containing protein n=1 Tax=Streptomyces stramineus TaxID=173861 RepID=A0ABP3JP66_9ACTN